MKLRIHGDSLRLRLNRSDVKQFLETGIRTESIHFGPAAKLTYTLESSAQLSEMESHYSQDCIRVLLPLSMAEEWASSDQISLSLDRAENSGPSLLIEKDFKCLHDDESNPDPNHIPSKFGRSLE
jgi:hypothetical protein